MSDDDGKKLLTRFSEGYKQQRSLLACTSVESERANRAYARANAGRINITKNIPKFKIFSFWKRITAIKQ